MLSAAAGSQQSAADGRIQMFATAGQGTTAGARSDGGPSLIVHDGLWDRGPGATVQKVVAIGVTGLFALLLAALFIGRRSRGRRMRPIAAAAVLVVLGMPVSQAKAEAFLTYQGRVLVDGNGPSGVGYFKFALLDSNSNVLWTSDGVFPEPTAPIELGLLNGFFLAYLGQSMASLDPGDFAGEDLVLRIWFASTQADADQGKFTLLAPDLRFGDVPRAFEASIAGEARTLEGRGAADFASAQHTHSADSIVSGTLPEGRIPASIARDAEILPTVLQADGAGSTLDADLFDGQDASFFRDASHLDAGMLPDVRLSLNVALLGGRTGGQSLAGGTAASETLTLDATAHATKGDIALNPSGGNVGVGTASPGAKLDVVGGAIRTDTQVIAPVLGTTSNTALELRANGVRAMRFEPRPTSPNLVGGSSSNAVTSGVWGAAIGGGGTSGQENLVTDLFGTIGGGVRNQAGDSAGNVSDKVAATVAGGQGNRAIGSHAAVGGGNANQANGDFATVGGGRANQVTGLLGAIGGGGMDPNDPPAVFGNRVTDDFGVIGGGHSNLAGDALGSTTDKAYATVGGGTTNTANGFSATVGGGNSNQATSSYATVSGGLNNLAGGSSYATVGGGQLNEATGSWTTVSGGLGNTASANSGAVGGGQGNNASGDLATIAGGSNSIASGAFATIAGGRSNRVIGALGAIGGGGADLSNPSALGNRVTDDFGTVGGGSSNRAGDDAGTTADRACATVGGGKDNTASGDRATIGGGELNQASGSYAAIGGGSGNTATGSYATVPGGLFSRASLHGQFAHASGGFVSTGDAQTSVFVLRQITPDATESELFLDGAAARLSVASGRSLAFDVLLIARSSSGSTGGSQSAAYHAQGLIENVSGTMSFVSATPTFTVLGEDDAAWNATLLADSTNDALVIKVTGNAGDIVRWVATVRTTEVSW